MKKTYVYNKETGKMELKKKPEIDWIIGVDLAQGEDAGFDIMGMKVKVMNDYFKLSELYK